MSSHPHTAIVEAGPGVCLCVIGDPYLLGGLASLNTGVFVAPQKPSSGPMAVRFPASVGAGVQAWVFE